MKDAYATKNGSSESTEFLLEETIDSGYNNESANILTGMKTPVSIIIICVTIKPWNNNIDDTISAAPIIIEEIKKNNTLAAYICG